MAADKAGGDPEMSIQPGARLLSLKGVEVDEFSPVQDLRVLRELTEVSVTGMIGPHPDQYVPVLFALRRQNPQRRLPSRLAALRSQCKTSDRLYPLF